MQKNKNTLYRKYIYNLKIDMLETKQHLNDWLKQPATIWKIIVFIFLLWATYTSLRISVSSNTERLESLEELELDVSIAKIQTDISWIRNTLEDMK